jgi:NAD+ diphosphatase
VRGPDPNTFTGAGLDRATDGRRGTDGWLEGIRADPRGRALVAGTTGLRAASGRLDLVRLDELDAGGGHPQANGPHLLGIDAEGPLWAVDEDPPDPRPASRPPLIGAGWPRGEAPPERDGRMGLREAASVLPQREGALAAYAASVLNWHRTNRFCSICGSATDPGEGGLARTCGLCGTNHHPRVEPVVIMLVTDGDRVLLGRQHRWPPQRYSALAGFVSQAESLEEAVAREVEEEAGVEVGEPIYLSSQPWPFPSSLMVAFEVPWLAGEPGGRDPELQDVRWFSHGEVAEAAARNESWDGEAEGALQLPPRSAIARRLLERWLAR